MKHFYIQSNGGTEEVCKYSSDFYQLVLKAKGYISIDSRESISTVLSAVASKDLVHLEIGLLQKKETELLLLMLNANYKHVVVTLHDAPLIKFPSFDFRNSVLNSLSKFYEKYAVKKETGISFVKKIKQIYVLSRAGVEAVKEKYKIENVTYLPQVINPAEIITGSNRERNLIYAGPVEPDRGIEYCLELHQLMLVTKPEIQFYIAGDLLNGNKPYVEKLKSKYRRNLHFKDLRKEEYHLELFQNALFGLLLFDQNKSVTPSGNRLLYFLKNGIIPVATPANSVPEIIQNGTNGFYLTMKLKKDAETLLGLLNEKKIRIARLKENIAEYLALSHSPEKIKNILESPLKDAVSSDCQL